MNEMIIRIHNNFHFHEEVLDDSAAGWRKHARQVRDLATHTHRERERDGSREITR
jgi:hypothetical protein